MQGGNLEKTMPVFMGQQMPDFVMGHKVVYKRHDESSFTMRFVSDSQSNTGTSTKPTASSFKKRAAHVQKQIEANVTMVTKKTASEVTRNTSADITRKKSADLGRKEKK